MLHMINQLLFIWLPYILGSHVNAVQCSSYESPSALQTLYHFIPASSQFCLYNQGLILAAHIFEREVLYMILVSSPKAMFLCLITVQYVALQAWGKWSTVSKRSDSNETNHSNPAFSYWRIILSEKNVRGKANENLNTDHKQAHWRMEHFCQSHRRWTNHLRLKLIVSLTYS